jgi:hypothetical protein
VDRLHHAFEDRIEELARFFGVTVGEQLHRPFEVGEQDGDLLALTFEGCLGGEDPLGEVLGRVRLRRVEARLNDWPSEGTGALRAELRGGGDLHPAARAGTR